MERILKETFKKGSKTYFNSSIFFPKYVREDVFKLYGFVRVADNYVDAVPQQKEEFYRFKESYEQAIKGKSSDNVIIDSFVELSKRLDFDPQWAKAFFHSMELDIKKSNYRTLDETLEYIYGSAEVIGLFMGRILGLDPESAPLSRMMGRAMQYINFIRDIDEDNGFGRTYLPLEGSELDNLSREETEKKPEKFRRFIQTELKRYKEWQAQAIDGYRFIPKRYLIPIKTAADMYWWTAEQIEKQPFIVFERKVKPSKLRILFRLIGNALSIPSDRKRGLR